MSNISYDSNTAIDKLVQEGYRVEKATIKCADILISTEGLLTFKMRLDIDGKAYYFGDANLGKVNYKKLDEYVSSPRGIEYIMRVMDVVGVYYMSDLNNRTIYAAIKNSRVDIIGNMFGTKWFNQREFKNSKLNSNKDKAINYISLDELRQMNGKPVFVVSSIDFHESGYSDEWCIVNNSEATAKGANNIYYFRDYRSHWLAYRTMPSLWDMMSAQ